MKSIVTGGEKSMLKGRRGRKWWGTENGRRKGVREYIGGSKEQAEGEEEGRKGQGDKEGVKRGVRDYTDKEGRGKR